MDAHPVAAALSVLCALFGVAFLAAFFIPFDRKVIAAQRMDDALADGQATGDDDADPFAELRKVWRRTKGHRWLAPVGVALCLASWLVHALFVAA